MPLHKPERSRAPKKRRLEGHVASWQASEHGGFGVLVGKRGGRYFFHAVNLLDPTVRVKVGFQAWFTPLPPAKPGSMKRANEVEIVRRKRGA